jgi:hypothetical protein
MNNEHMNFCIEPRSDGKVDPFQIDDDGFLIGVTVVTMEELQAFTTDLLSDKRA